MQRKLGIVTVLCFALFEFSLAQSIGGAVSGSTAFCTSQNSGFVSLSGYQGTILFWQTSTNDGASWNTIGNANSTQSYYNVTTTTLFRAIVKEGISPSDTSNIAKILIHPKAIAGTITGGGRFCYSSGTGVLNITGAQGNVEKWQYSTDGGANWLAIFTTVSSMTYSDITQSVDMRVIVSNIPGCPFDTSAVESIKIDARSNAGTIFGKDSVCYGDKDLVLETSAYTGAIVEWKKIKLFDNSWTTINISNDSLFLDPVTQAYSYAVIVKNGVCPADTSDKHKIIVHAVNPANAGNDITVEQREGFRLNGSGNGKPVWLDENNTPFSASFNAYVYPEKTVTYTMILTDVNGCVTKDAITINVIIPIPNAISPNNDNVNDRFEIDGITEYTNSKLQIFNKWGKLVYEASPYLNEFKGISNKGDELQDEVYYYTLDLGNGDEVRKNYLLIKR